MGAPYLYYRSLHRMARIPSLPFVLSGIQNYIIIIYRLNKTSSTFLLLRYTN